MAVGSGFVAFLTVLGVIPRLTQLSKTMKMIQHYEWAVVLGALTGVGASLRDPILNIPSFPLIFLGLTGGIFLWNVGCRSYRGIKCLSHSRQKNPIRWRNCHINYGDCIREDFWIYLPMGLFCSSLKLLKTV